MPRRNIRSSPLSLLSLAGLSLLAPLAASPALGQGANNNQQTPARSPEYVIHWAVNTWLAKTRMVDYAAQINLAGTPIKRDAVVFYEADGGLYPAGGIQMVDADAGYMQRHFQRLAQNIAAKIPDPAWNGYACIDYETWHPQWSKAQNVPSNKARDAADFDFKQDWEDHLLANRPAVLRGLTGAARENALKTSYETATHKFFLDTLREAKRLRPNAKWGFYGFPGGEYYTFWNVRADPWKAFNQNEMGWLFDAVDVLFPHVYPVKVTVEDREPRNGQENTPAQNATYIKDNVAEAVRNSRGKPVLAFVHFKYHPSMPAGIAGTWVNDVSIRQQIQLPKEAGAQGVMIWDCIESEQHFRDLSALVLNRVVPKALQVATNAATSGNGGSTAAAGSRPAAGAAVKLPNGQVIISSSSSKPAGSQASVPHDK